jgi:tripartite-type tricarboxylate transporter receptor subunit TctC
MTSVNIVRAEIGNSWRRHVCMSLLALAAAVTTPVACAQPTAVGTAPVKIIVPYPPGGPADVVARTLANKLAISEGRPFIVENRSGAGGNIGTDEVAKAPADGLTLLLGTNGPLVVNAALYSKLPFDPVKDFAPITQVAEIPLVLLAHPSVPVNSVQELIAYAKANPGKLSYGSSGVGSGGHLAGALLASMAGIDLAHVPYRGMAPATSDLVAGHVKLMVGGLLAVKSFIDNGTLKALAVVTPHRAAAAPQIPTVAESGLPGFQIVSWYGVLAPAKTPPEIIKRLHDDIVAALNLPDVKEKLFVQGGLDMVASSPDEFAATIRREIPEYARIVKLTGATAQ